MENQSDIREKLTRFWNNDKEFQKEINSLLIDSKTEMDIVRAVLTDNGQRIDNKSIEHDTEKDHRRIRARIKDFAEKKLISIIENNKEKIADSICEKFEFCKKYKSGNLNSDGLMLSITIADGLFSFSTGLPIPISLLSYYLVKNKLIFNLCECQK